MNSVGQPLQQRPLSTKLILAGILGLIVFVMFQVTPQLFSGSGEDTAVISKSEAREKAAVFAAEQLGHEAAARDEWNVLYKTDSSFYGYMSREKLLEDYNKNKLDQRYPFDVYHAVLYTSGEADALLSVDLNMYTGEVVAFARGAEVSAAEGHDYGEAPAAAVTKPAAADTANSEPGFTLEQKENLALPWLQLWGANPASLQIEASSDAYGLVYTQSSVKVGESPLRYNFIFSDDAVSYFRAGFTAPAWHDTYVDNQTALAKKLTLFGYGLPTLLLGILALIYSILRRGYTSFKRGIFLSSAHFLIMMVSSYNVLPESGGDSAEARITAVVMFIIYVLYSLLMSSLLYFSLVGGDGLWRKEGLNPWPRAKEPGYGQYVLDSIRAGYIWAFVLLGVQTIMFIILSYTLDNWSTTDASQSPFNMKYAWLLPIVAWLAGLSEEAVYRLFGIRMLKKLVKNTFIASLITTLIWAFGHTLYPIYPVSSRPIELTVIGLLFSYIFLRYGFIAVMFSHVVFDSILMGATLIFMQDKVNLGAGIVTIILPFVVAYIVYRFNPPRKPDPLEPVPPLT